MKISIITVCYNALQTIGYTINSVLSQDYPDIEYIIVDGKSTDGTVELLQQWSKEYPIRWVSEKDAGIYDAMNKGIAMATGDVIGILNADDFYSNSHVVSQIAETFRQQNVDSVYADLAYVDAENVHKTIRYWASGTYSHGAFLRGWMPPHPTFFVKREVYQQFGSFNLSFRSAADYELMLRLLHKNRVSTAYLPQVTVMMRVGGVSNSSWRNRWKANREDALAWKINGLQPRLFTMMLKPVRKVHQYVLAVGHSPASVSEFRYFRKLRSSLLPKTLTTN